METFTITKEHIKDGRYIGSRSEFDGHVLIEAGLGLVLFEQLSARGSIVAKIGSDIKVVKSVWAGWSISLGGDLTAGESIEAGWCISAKTISAGLHIKAGGSICSIDGVEAGGSVTKGKKA